MGEEAVRRHPGRSRAAWLIALSTAVLTACTLVTSLDGLTGGDSGAPDAAGTDAPSEGSDSQTTTDGSTIDGEAGPIPGAAYRAEVVADKPISYWRFEETSGTVAKDEMGAHDGTYVNGPTLGSPGFAAGTRAITIVAATKSHVLVPGTSFLFPGDTTFTFEVWAKPKVFSDYQWIGGTELPQSPRSGWSLLGHADHSVAYEAWTPPVTDGGSNYARSAKLDNKPLTANQFHHVVFTYDGAAIGGYVDGDFAGTGAALRPTAGGGELRWGCRNLLQGLDCLDGWSLDEAAIYDRALTAARIKAHFDASSR